MAANRVLEWVLRRFKRVKYKQLKKYSELNIVPAFEIKGRRFYQFSDMTLLPMQRVFHFEDVQNMLSRRIDNEALYRMIKAARECLVVKNGTMSPVDCDRILSEIEQREKWIVCEDTIYEIACVLFLEEGENPYVVSKEINDAKKSFWQKNEDVVNFFLRLPYIDWGLLQMNSEQYLENYIKGQRLDKEATINYLLGDGCSTQFTKETRDWLQSQRETLQTLKS